MKDPTVKLSWLNNKAPTLPTGVTWGIPWTKGELKREESLALIGPSGEQESVQSWATAYWPDGSVKWSAHAASLAPNAEEAYTLHKGEQRAPSVSLTVYENEESIEINTGKIICLLNKKGASLFRAIYYGGTEVCSDGKLIGLREEQMATSDGRVYKEESFVSSISKTVIEQQGKVRCVIRIEGTHKLTSREEEWLPFTLRVYFYANQDTFRVVHTFIYDGNQQKDFIKGLGMSFSLPMRGPLYNRHVRFMGDTGLFSESPKNLATIRTQGKYEQLFKQQAKGSQVAFDHEEDAKFIGLLEESAVWDSFKLVQDSPDYYSITKRTKAECCWLKAASGHRSGGQVFAGSEGGGMSVGVRNFWQKYPSSLEVNQMSKDEAELKVWFWSPDAKTMDLRHYDTTTHVASSYEGFDEMRSTPHGIGNTSELNIGCFEQTPDAETFQAMSLESQSPSLLVCEPEYYHSTNAFGVWSLADRSTPMKAMLEDQLESAITFYQNEIEQRRWYGFWDFGDVMHSYDSVRHTWRYDIGGCAWQNTELVPNMWLWFMFLRTGREDIFRMAEAMSRHTSEVDVYHLGEYAGLGSRHNVLHWGCGCKEARISMAGLHRFHYYLTADERMGDIMDEVKDADYATVDLDPMRSYLPKDEFPTHTRVGPDWSAFSSNWLTRWERFEDSAYRDKLLEGISCLKSMRFRLLTGPTFGYDPKTGKLHHMADDNWGRALSIGMGATQVWMELAQVLEDPEWDDMLVQFGEFYHLSEEEKVIRTDGVMKGNNWRWPVFASGIAAFAANRLNDEQLAKKVWGILLGGYDQNQTHVHFPLQTVAVPGPEYVRPIQEIPWIATNTISQWCLNTMVCLELIGEQLPEEQ